MKTAPVKQNMPNYWENLVVAEPSADETEKWTHDRGFIRLDKNYGVNINFPDTAETIVKRHNAALARHSAAKDKELREHRKHVGQFLSDLYATMIDPLAEGN